MQKSILSQTKLISNWLIIENEGISYRYAFIDVLFKRSGREIFRMGTTGANSYKIDQRRVKQGDVDFLRYMFNNIRNDTFYGKYNKARFVFDKHSNTGQYFWRYDPDLEYIQTITLNPEDNDLIPLVQSWNGLPECCYRPWINSDKTKRSKLTFLRHTPLFQQSSRITLQCN